MNDKSKWFYSDLKIDTKAVVVLAHGLNLLPSKMDEIAKFLALKKCDVLRISISENPDKWLMDFGDSYDAALEHSEILQRPLYFVGYSLGGLLGVHYIIKHPYQQFTKTVLIAPPTHTKAYILLPALLALIFPNGSLPSLNLENYRARGRTKFKEYKKLLHIQKEIRSDLKKNELNISTLVVINRHDELVASKRVALFAAFNPLWKTLTLTNQESDLPRKYHHLMIDSASLGDQEWNKLLKNLATHLDL